MFSVRPAVEWLAFSPKNGTVPDRCVNAYQKYDNQRRPPLRVIGLQFPAAAVFWVGQTELEAQFAVSSIMIDISFPGAKESTS